MEEIMDEGGGGKCGWSTLKKKVKKPADEDERKKRVKKEKRLKTEKQRGRRQKQEDGT